MWPQKFYSQNVYLCSYPISSEYSGQLTKLLAWLLDGECTLWMDNVKRMRLDFFPFILKRRAYITCQIFTHSMILNWASAWTGSVGLSMLPFGQSGPLWAFEGLSEYKWPKIGLIGQKWTTLDWLQLTKWVSNCLRGPKWVSVGKSGPQGVKVDLRGSKWISGGQSGSQPAKVNLSGSQLASISQNGHQWALIGFSYP